MQPWELARNIVLGVVMVGVLVIFLAVVIAMVKQAPSDLNKLQTYEDCIRIPQCEEKLTNTQYLHYLRLKRRLKEKL